MENIFDTNELYPGYDDILKEYFKDHFDSVFVSLLPFFTIAKSDTFGSVRGSKMISYEEYIEQPDALNLAPNNDRVIYIRDTQYPDRDQIINTAKPIMWAQIINNTLIKDIAEMNLALRTSIGALRVEYERKDLQAILDDHTSDLFVYHPIEGRIGVLSLIKIYHCLKALNKTNLVVTDEFFQDRKLIDIAGLSLQEYISQVHGYIYYFPEDLSILFTIEWDSFFFLICANKPLLQQIVEQYEFEGFYCDNTTMHG